MLDLTTQRTCIELFDVIHLAPHDKIRHYSTLRGRSLWLAATRGYLFRRDSSSTRFCLILPQDQQIIPCQKNKKKQAVDPVVMIPVVRGVNTLSEIEGVTRHVVKETTV